MKRSEIEVKNGEIGVRTLASTDRWISSRRPDLLIWSSMSVKREAIMSLESREAKRDELTHGFRRLEQSVDVVLKKRGKLVGQEISGGRRDGMLQASS